mgnify:CR=1 FL=1
MVDEKTSNNLLSALQARAVAQKTEAYATLMLYLNNPVAVPDHPNILDELESQLSKLQNADDMLSTLDRYFRTPEEKKEE